MKRCFAKIVFVAVTVVTISLANVSECKAFVYFNLFGFGAGYQPYSQAGYSPSAYGNYHNTGYGDNGYYGAGYRSAYHSPRGSYYHAPMNSYGWRGSSTGYRGFFGGSWRGHSSCGRPHRRSRCNTGCSTSHYPVNQCSPVGGCATGQYGAGQHDSGEYPTNNNPAQSPTPLKTYDDNDVPDPRKTEKYKRSDRGEEIDKTGSEQFRRSRNAGKIEDDRNRNDDRRDDDKGAFGGEKRLNENQDNSRTEERDGIGSRKSEEPKPPVLETPSQPKDDPFVDPEKKRSTFKIPAKTSEGVEALDKIMDDFNALDTNATNNKTNTKPKGAPTKNPLEERPSTKKKPAEMPRLEVKPIGLGESVARRTIPNYRRLSMRSRYFAPQIARTRLNHSQKKSFPLFLQPETKLVSK
ncbi:hypothetical protein MNBD_PLANCTO02-1112 [hydrothermal vent metagenome]|uniref:Uncharacterized protein n=1 Tax=hydrothermal vent metagenome TaxID=652676 RepID=A0A3B1DUX0_9ZZZZ